MTTLQGQQAWSSEETPESWSSRSSLQKRWQDCVSASQRRCEKWSCDHAPRRRQLQLLLRQGKERKKIFAASAWSTHPPTPSCRAATDASVLCARLALWTTRGGVQYAAPPRVAYSYVVWKTTSRSFPSFCSSSHLSPPLLISPPTSLLPPSTAHLLCFAQPSFGDISSVPTREPRWANGTTEEERVAPGGRRSAPVRGWRSSLRGREEAKELLWVWTWAGRTAGWWPRRRRRRRRTEAGTTVQTRDTGVDGDSSLSKEHRFVAAKAAFCASGAFACSLARARSLSLSVMRCSAPPHTHMRVAASRHLFWHSPHPPHPPLPLLSTSR